MKFGKYLEDSMVPEWRHAYMHYKSLKKIIKQWSTTVSDTTAASIASPEDMEMIMRNELSRIQQFFVSRCELIVRQYNTLTGELPIQGNIHTFKLHCIDLYNHCDYLENFQILNKIAVTKTLKKFDKHVQHDVHLVSNLNSIITEYSVFTSRLPHETKEQTRQMLLIHVYGGDSKKLSQRIRPVVKDRQIVSAFRLGLSLGISVIIMTFNIFTFFQFKIHPIPPHVLYLYGGIFLTIEAMFGYAASIYMCTAKRINYVFILELDKRSCLTFMQIAEVASILFTIFAGAMFVHLHWALNWSLSAYIPLYLCAFYLVIMFCPFPILYPWSRWWFIRTFLRIMLPVRRIRFADFFMADLMISLTFFWTSIYVGSCFYLSADHENPLICNVKTSWISATLISWSLIVRFIQCLRRYFDDARNTLHLKNAFKYILTIATVYLNTLSGVFHGRAAAFAIWIVFAAISSVYSFAWDVMVDWGIFRKERAFQKKVMSTVVVLDVILRMSWVLTLSPTFIVTNYVLAWCLACIEVIRRYMWSLFRLEHEHSNNVEHYRAVKEIPMIEGQAAEDM